MVVGDNVAVRVDDGATSVAGGAMTPKEEVASIKLGGNVDH
jgi:hypothetical protein